MAQTYFEILSGMDHNQFLSQFEPGYFPKITKTESGIFIGSFNSRYDGGRMLVDAFLTSNGNNKVSSSYYSEYQQIFPNSGLLKMTLELPLKSYERKGYVPNIDYTILLSEEPRVNTLFDIVNNEKREFHTVISTQNEDIKSTFDEFMKEFHEKCLYYNFNTY